LAGWWLGRHGADSAAGCTTGFSAGHARRALAAAVGAFILGLGMVLLAKRACGPKVSPIRLAHMICGIGFGLFQTPQHERAIMSGAPPPHRGSGQRQRHCTAPRGLTGADALRCGVGGIVASPAGPATGGYAGARDRGRLCRGLGKPDDFLRLTVASTATTSTNTGKPDIFSSQKADSFDLKRVQIPVQDSPKVNRRDWANRGSRWQNLTINGKSFFQSDVEPATAAASGRFRGGKKKCRPGPAHTK